MHPLQGKKVVLGISGSVAAYKSGWLASRLTQAGAEVTAVLTDAATHFIAPLTFQSLTGNAAYTDADLWASQGHILHVGLGQWADLLIIAPATANTIAKLATGQGDNLLTLTALSTKAPILIAPAMDGEMFSHPATQANLTALKKRGVHVVGPSRGRLASGLIGPGRMAEPEEILGAARYLLTRHKPLRGYRVLVTAGGTREPLDPVRVLTNRSSGKQGFALAQAALDWGAEATLIAAPSCLKPPYGAKFLQVQTAQEMHEAVMRELGHTDILLMAAAVADYRPAQFATQKIKKATNGLSLNLVRTVDILAEIGKKRSQFPNLRVVVGFAAESQDLLENARSKLERKHLNLIAANDITSAGAGFGQDTNRVTLLFPNGRVEPLPLMSKAEVAHQIILRVLMLLQGEQIVHLASKYAWEEAKAKGYYAPVSLQTNGFIHFSRLDQVARVANILFPNRHDLLMLFVPLANTAENLKWEEVGGDLFPHLYAPLSVQSVISVKPYQPGKDGRFPEIKWGKGLG